MKSISFFSFLSISLLCLFLIACSGAIGGNVSEYYYQQQSGSNAEPELEPPVEEKPEEELPEGTTIITMFDVLQPNGEIDEELFAKFPQDVQNSVRATLKDIPKPVTSNFINRRIVAHFTNKNVPIMQYIDGSWGKSTDIKYLVGDTENKYVYEGDNTTAGNNPITHVRYHMYDGKNPFYSATGFYNTATYGDKTDTRINRFMFYRFTGKGGGVAALDNMLVAVDTYTGLIFGFGKPTEFVTMLGIDNPTRWEAVEVAADNINTTNYKFYDCDPAGYVADDGTFFMYDWYNTNLAQANKANHQFFNPQFTSVSPYLHRVIEGTVVVIDPFIPVITATTDVALVETSEENNGKYYTDITFPEHKSEIKYELYIREGETGEWSSEVVTTVTVPANTTEESARTYRHYDALILSDLPQYKAIAKNPVDDKELGTSNPVEGSRGLTERELLLAAIETIRGVCIDKGAWYERGNVKKNFLLHEDDGDGMQNGIVSGKYYHGVRWTSGRLAPATDSHERYQSFKNYESHLVTLNGTFMQDNGDGMLGNNRSYNGLWCHNGETWPDFNAGPNGGWFDKWKDKDKAENFLPRTEALDVTYNGVTINVVFNNIDVKYEMESLPFIGDTNEIGNKPIWNSGSFKIGETKYDNASGVPFGFFMDATTFRNALGGSGYKQQ